MQSEKKNNGLLDFLIKKTFDSPISIHIDGIGLLRLGGKKLSENIKIFNSLLTDIEQEGGNIIIPSYSMSYTKNEKYSIKESSSETGMVTDYLRKIDYEKRTHDGLFSYISYSQNMFQNHKNFTAYESFGKGSVIDELYQKNGYIGVLGCGLRMMTEIYYLENIQNVPYRYTKQFTGTIQLIDNTEKLQEISYFCRNTDLFPDLLSDFVRLEFDLRNEGLVEKWKYNDQMMIEVIKFQELHDFISKKLKNNLFYLTLPKDKKQARDGQR